MPTDLDIEREFADLVETLREDRTEIDPHFARELDNKVAAGFPREPRWRRVFTTSPMLVPGVAASMLLALVVGIAMLPAGSEDEYGAGAGGGGSESGATPALSVPESAEDAGGDQDAAGGGGNGQQYSQRARRAREKSPSSGAALSDQASPPVAGGGSVAADRVSGRNRKVETSASLVLGAKPGGVQRVADEVVAVTDRHHGFVLSSSVDLADGGGGAQFSLRVPSDELKATLTDLSRIGDVRERREAVQDITREFVSARSRLADARADRRGLLRRLARALTDAERESLKLQLRDVGGRIAAARTDLARVNNRASFSNIAVTIVGDPAAGAEEEDGTWSPGDAAKDAVRVLEVAAGVLLIALAIALPVVLLALLALLLARLAGRRRRERLLDAV